MKKIRKWSFILISACIVLWGIYVFLYGWVVPKTAVLTIPRKWKMIPLGQSKIVVHGYLGEPAVTNDPADRRYEQWGNGSKQKLYLLRVYYVSDTIAAAYSIHYQLSNKLVSRDYLVDSISIR